MAELLNNFTIEKINTENTDGTTLDRTQFS